MGKTYTVFTFKSYEGREGWVCRHVRYDTLAEFLKNADGYWQQCGKNLLEAGCSWDIEERTMEDIARDISTGKFMFMPFSKNVRRMDMMLYLKAGFELRFMKAKQFTEWKKDYCAYM
jgi:hypothetical protein